MLKLLSLLLLLYYNHNHALARLEHSHIQQLAYTFDTNDVTVFIHIDNETVQIDTNKEAHHCLKRLPHAVDHCDQILKIKFRHNFDMDYEEENEAESNQTQVFNQTQKINDTYTKTENVTTLPYNELECCIHWVLYDCLDYIFKKKCSPKAYQVLSQVNKVALLGNLNCTDEYHNSDKCNVISDPSVNKALVYRRMLGKKSGVDGRTNWRTDYYALVLISLVVVHLFR